MKICVLNLSGNVGKSTLAVHLLAAFRPGAKFLSIETFNSTSADTVASIEVEEWAASQFNEIFRELMINDDVILDVGSSNIATFMAQMKRFKSAVGEFDMVLVPTVPDQKQQDDTISTIEWLHDHGMDRKKVRVVFNNCHAETGNQIEAAYHHVAGYARADGKNKAVFEPYAVVDANEIYQLIKRSKKTVKELAEDTTDWRAKRNEAKKAGDIEGMEAAIEAQMSHDLAQTAQENLAQVHELLFGKVRKA
jgi:MinD-like ATPase involved in chromosome partitioning or flagellar assembly